MGDSRPIVSIGLPVYNGERFLAQAIESILAQTYAHFELIICDNASTDRTATICREFAARDSRIRYERNETNLGALPNFNKVFLLSRGKYFRWAAHDDVLGPRYLELCVKVLEEQPEVVLCHACTTVIDAQSREVTVYEGPEPDAAALASAERDGGMIVPRNEVYDPTCRRIGSRDVAHRFADILTRTRWCFEIFGLMRTELLRNSPLHQSFYGSDKVLLAAMALRGPFVEVPHGQFFRRYHAGQSSNKSYKDLAVWSDPSGKHGCPPQVKCGQWYFKLVSEADLGLWDRFRCYAGTVHWAFWLCELIYRERNSRGFLHRVMHSIKATFGALDPPREAARSAAASPAAGPIR